MGDCTGNASREPLRVLFVAGRSELAISIYPYCLGRRPDGMCIGMQVQVPEEKWHTQAHKPCWLHSRSTKPPLRDLM